MYYFLSRKETHDFSKAVFQFDAKAMEIYKAFLSLLYAVIVMSKKNFYQFFNLCYVILTLSKFIFFCGYFRSSAKLFSERHYFPKAFCLFVLAKLTCFFFYSKQIKVNFFSVMFIDWITYTYSFKVLKKNLFLNEVYRYLKISYS